MPRLVQPSQNISEGRWRPECVVCKEAVEIEESKVDEHGQAIHEECYVFRLVGKDNHENCMKP